jgi:hypothetical protein
MLRDHILKADMKLAAVLEKQRRPESAAQPQ